MLNDIDALVIGGGMTPAYLAAVEPIMEEIRLLVADGLPYLGFSAGAMIAADRAVIGGWRIDGVQVCPEETGEDLDEVTIVEGLGLVDLAIDVHAAQWGTLGRLVAATEAGLVGGGVAIDEFTALVVADDGLRVVGTGSVWRVLDDPAGVIVGALGAVTLRRGRSAELVDPGWARALEPVAGQVAAMGEFLRAETAAGRRYLPAGENVLRAFRAPFDDVRVLIVGQDPYPTPGHPIGLSFAVDAARAPGAAQPAEHLPRAARRPRASPPPPHGDLTAWTEQGVLLLNRVLTVQAGASGSHRGKGWEAVTEAAIRALVARGAPARRDPVGSGCRHAATAARRHPGDRVGAPEPAVGVAAGSSDRGRSAGPTSCSSPRAATPSTGRCRPSAPI